MQMHSDTHTLTSDTEPTPMSEFTDCEELVMNNEKKEQNFKETRRTEYLLSITEARTSSSAKLNSTFARSPAGWSRRSRLGNSLIKLTADA